MNKRIQYANSIWNKAIWGIIIISTVLYVTLIWNINVTTDEIFTLKLIKRGISGIIEGTAADVHPPLYYFYAYLFEILSPQNIHLQKVITIIPMIGTMLYIGCVARKWIGDKATFFALLFFSCVPCTMEYAVQIRMYSLAILCVTLCGVSAYAAYVRNLTKDWILCIIGAVGAAYLHYFAFVAVCFEVGLLFIVVIYRLIWCKNMSKNSDRENSGTSCFVNPRTQVIRWLISIVVMIILYIPWLPTFYKQVTSVREDYWIPPIDGATIWGYFTWAFDSELIPGVVYGYIVVLAALIVYGVYKLIRHRKKELSVGFFALLIPILTATSGTIISLSKSPIFCGRYVIVAMMMLALFFGIMISNVLDCNNKSARVATIIVTIFLVISGIMQYAECIKQEYIGHHTKDTVEFFEMNLGDNDYVLYNYKAMEFVYDYYFPEDKLIYVEDFDLDCDYDNVWFLYTLNEWPVTQQDCVVHNLDMIYVGEYGVEGNIFDVFRIWHK